MYPFLSSLARLFTYPRFWLLAVSGFTLLYYFLAHEGFYFGDDYSYGLYAHQLLHGGFHFDDYSFCHRFLVFVPTALFYLLGGVNIYTTTLWPLLCTLGTLLLLYLTFRREHPVATAWALVLLGLYYFQLNTVNYLYPDNILLFFTTACLLLLYRARKPLPTRKAEMVWGTAFAALNLLAFLTKETIVYTVPFYGCLFIYHAIRRDNLWFWAMAALTGALLLSVYFLLYHVYAGDALQRLYDIQATNTLDTRQAYLNNRSATLLPRLTFEPLLFFVGSGLAIPLGFAALALIAQAKTRLFALDRTHSFWLVALGSMLLPIWFGTATVDFYKPMPLVPRMFHPLLPAFCLVAGLALERVWGKPVASLFLALLFGVCIPFALDDLWVMYSPLALLFLALYLYRHPVPHGLVLGVVALVLSIRPLYFMVKPTVSYYFEQQHIIDTHLSHSRGQHLVFTDPVMVRRHPFFYGYQVPQNYTFSEYGTATPTLYTTADTVFLLINNGVLEHPELMLQLREQDILPRYPTAELLRQKGKVKLYFLPKNNRP